MESPHALGTHHISSHFRTHGGWAEPSKWDSVELRLRVLVTPSAIIRHPTHIGTTFYYGPFLGAPNQHINLSINQPRLASSQFRASSIPPSLQAVSLLPPPSRRVRPWHCCPSPSAAWRRVSPSRPWVRRSGRGRSSRRCGTAGGGCGAWSCCSRRWRRRWGRWRSGWGDGDDGTPKRK